MAIKVLAVEADVVLVDEQRGQAQDFVMINHPVFFARNVKDYLRLEQVLVQADDSALATLKGGLTGGDWNPLHWHWREMLAVGRIAGQLPFPRAGKPSTRPLASRDPCRIVIVVGACPIRTFESRTRQHLSDSFTPAWSADSLRGGLP
jgi:hypothetical protein